MNRLHKISQSIATFGAILLLLTSTSPQVFAATNTEISDSVRHGMAYLATTQQANGSIGGFGGESDWAAIALTASDTDLTSFSNSDDISLYDFITQEALTQTPLTQIERKILALSAAEQDPSEYIAELTTAHSEGQLGDPTLLNDDIFGILAIAAYDDEALLPVAQDSLNYLLSYQQRDGGFSYTTEACDWCTSDSNMTAAAIVAFEVAADIGLTHDRLEEAQSAAVSFVLATQQSDGGFAYDSWSVADGSSTAWAVIALNSVGMSASDEAMSGREWLLDNQNDDGGFSYGAYGYNDSDTYTTSHALLALLGTNWLLDPAPLELVDEVPDVSMPIHPEPAPAIPQTIVTTFPTSRPSSTVTVISTADSALNPAEEVESAKTEVDDTAEEKPAASDESNEAMTENQSSLRDRLGYAFMAVAIIGLVGYISYIHRLRAHN